MYKEILYFGAELLNYWAMTFWGLKLLIEMYRVPLNIKQKTQNYLLGIISIPIALFCAGNYKYVSYSTSFTYFIILYLYIIMRIVSKRKCKVNLTLMACYVFIMRLIDLWFVAVITEVNKFSRHIYIELINMGIGRTIFMIILSCIYYCVYCICRKSYFIDYLRQNKFYRIVICAYSFVGNLCFCTVYRFDYKEKLISYWIFYLVCAFILVGGFLLYFIEIKGKERERLLNMRNDMMEANYQGLQKAYDANRVLQHDNKNHMLAMYELIKENKNEEALNYINMWMSISQKSLIGVKSGNEILDIIVNSKVNEAKDKQIDFQYDIKHLGDINIADVDMCALLANLIDNAIEASEKVIKNPWIHLKIHRKNDTMLILIKNSISKEMLTKKKFFQTEKENSNLHGWGMKSIERVVHKYDGEIEHTWKEESFETFVTIPL